MIESLQNEKIKRIARLQSKNSDRKKQGVFLVEGRQENKRALSFNYEALEFFICEPLYNDIAPEGIVHYVSQQVYEKIAYRGSSEGIIGIYKTPSTDLKNINLAETTSIIVIEGTEKPGNLGAILRSCEAFGTDALINTDPKVDYFNPNVIRSSVGCLFGMNFYSATNEELLTFLQNHDFKIVTTFMEEQSVNLYEVSLTGRTALLFGTEHSGLSEFWKDTGTNALIPTSGTIDSLNLSNAVAISCYEIIRQKINA